MNRRENNRFAMFRVVEAVLLSFDEVVKTIPAFARVVKSFNDSISRIQKLDNDYQIVSKGTTADKNQIRDLLVEETDELCGTLCSFAKETGNLQIVAITDIPISGLEGLRDEELYGKGKVVLELLLANEANLKEYDIETDEIAAYQKLVDSFDGSSKTQDSKGTQAQAARNELSKAFTATNDILVESLDKLIKRRRKKNPELFNQYEKARIIKDLGVRHVITEKKSQPAAV